jgi:signal transduction histidine kinase
MIFVREEGRLVRLATAFAVSIGPDPDLHSSIDRVMKTGTAEMTHEPRSRILAPISAGKHIAGALAVLSAKPCAFDAEDMRLFEAIGRRAGVALDNARLYQETQKANRLKDEFVAIISHELRTPLTPILGGVYMIRSEPDNDQVLYRALDLIERNAKTQAKIVDDLLDVSRALTGKLRLNLDAVDLDRVIRAAVETIQPASDAKDLKIDVRILPIKGHVSGDADRLQQVVWNLLSNAVKFTPSSGYVTVELAEEAGQAEIRVSDNGIGIDADFLPHVFDKFRQANTSRTRPHAGLGLGLAIVRHIVESHGGTVQAYSSGSELGATFVVRLPVRNAMNARRGS